MTKHILFILDYYPPHRGGAETVFENITQKLQQRWYKITVLTSRFLPSLPVYESLHGISVYRTWSGRISFLFSALYRWYLLCCRDKTITFIHTSTYGGAIPAWIVWFLCHKKVVLTVHEVFGRLWSLYKPWPASLVYRFFEWLLFAFPYDCYHVVSMYTYKSIRSLYHIPDKLIRLVYNGIQADFWDKNLVSQSSIDLRRKKYGRGDRFVLLYYGHSGKSKWLDYLIDALPAIFTQYPDLLFVCNLIHAKRDRETKNKLSGLGYAKNIQLFDGFSLASLRTLVVASDCVIAPSISEWFGSVHAEVSSMQKILITTPVTAIPEVVHGNVVFIDPQSPDAIVQAVINVRNHIITSIPQKVFPWEATIDGIEQMYHEFIFSSHPTW